VIGCRREEWSGSHRSVWTVREEGREAVSAASASPAAGRRKKKERHRRHIVADLRCGGGEGGEEATSCGRKGKEVRGLLPGSRSSLRVGGKGGRQGALVLSCCFDRGRYSRKRGREKKEKKLGATANPQGSAKSLSKKKRGDRALWNGGGQAAGGEKKGRKTVATTELKGEVLLRPPEGKKKRERHPRTSLTLAGEKKNDRCLRGHETIRQKKKILTERGKREKRKARSLLQRWRGRMREGRGRKPSNAPTSLFSPAIRSHKEKEKTA